MKINNLHLFVASTIRLNKRNQVGVTYLASIVYELKSLVIKYTPSYEDEVYEFYNVFLQHKSTIQQVKANYANAQHYLLKLSKDYPRWLTRKNKKTKATKMYWKRFYKRKLEAETIRLENAYRNFETAFPNYLIQFNEFYERVKNVCVSERK